MEGPLALVQETPLHFHSRLDGRQHTGQLIRNVLGSARSELVGPVVIDLIMQLQSCLLMPEHPEPDLLDT